ncbi:hypothetical protein AcW1_002626 [Taiwanofungus camphoratus]|nr:hypothetical protein AcV5_009691 [Antrodia cinnamomea]KAI0943474.1 hypothetical protein AcW1_002626 [Antrodia cinnamomea]
MASQHGNPDAQERHQALSQPSPLSLSRQEHEALTDTRRRRTQARLRSEAAGHPANGSGLPKPPVDNLQFTSDISMRGPVASQGIPRPPTYDSTQGNSPLSDVPPGVRPLQLHRKTASSSSILQLPPSWQGPSRFPSPYTKSALSTPGGQQGHFVNASGTSPRLEPQCALETSPLSRPSPPRGPQTFQEMGFTSQKLEKDCVIM